MFESADRLMFAPDEKWPCNWFQQVENSLDATHVSFVHHWGEVGRFGQHVAPTIPKLEYLETDAGIRQIATRSKDSVRVSDAVVDRTQERLGRSDMGIAFVRRIFLRELEAIRNGNPTKDWRRLQQATEMPHQVHEPVES